ncbi:MAG: universal stress protein [Caldilineaceae bacterium]
MKVNHVLIPIDRSDFSLLILPWIEQFLPADRNALIFFHVAEEPKPTYLRSMSEEEADAERQRLIESLYIAFLPFPYTTERKHDDYAGWGLR